MDRVPTVAQTAALAVGRMAAFSAELAEELVRSSILGDLIAAMRASTLPGQLKASAFVLRCVAGHAAELAGAVLALGGAAALVHALAHTDVTVREAAAAALAVVATHEGAASQELVDAGSLPLLVAALGEPEAALKRAAAIAIADVVKHGPTLAAAAVDAGALPFLVSALRVGATGAPPPPFATTAGVGGVAGDAAAVSAGLARVRRAATSALGSIARHTPALAETVVAARALPTLLAALQDTDEAVRSGAAVVLREIVKHSEALATIAAEAGAVGAAVQYMTAIGAPVPSDVLASTLAVVAPGSGAGSAGTARGAVKLPAVMAIGFVAAYSPPLALAVIAAAGVDALKAALTDAGAEEHARAAAVWALGQVGKHSPETARAVTAADCLRLFLALASAPTIGDDLRDKSRRALLATVAQCDVVPALAALLAHASPAPAKAVLAQVAALVRQDPGARRALLAGGGLKLIQRLDPTGRASVAVHGAAALRNYAAASASAAGLADAAALFSPAHADSCIAAVASGAVDPDLEDAVAAVNDAFPADVVAHCRPDYGLELVARAQDVALAESRDMATARMSSAIAAAAAAAVTHGA